VSGLLLFARGPDAANALRLQIQAGDVAKEYAALVRGAFPAGPARVVDAPMGYDYRQRRSVVGERKGAKPAATAFRLLAVAEGGERSLVACRPLTGRTHQIRAHLQHAGFPIANDVMYGGFAEAPAAPAPGDDDRAGGRHECKQDALCTHCPWLAPQSHEADVEALFLHACRYGDCGGGWRFEAPLPPWAGELLGAESLPEGLWEGVSEETLRRYHESVAPEGGEE